MNADLARTADDTHELFRLGPLRGLDPTTAPYELNPASFLFPDGENVVPAENYGGFSTVLGRAKLFTNTLPALPTGGFVWHRPNGLGDVYFFYVTDNSGQGQIYWAPPGGTLTLLATYPDAATTGYAPNATVSFTALQSWCFMSDGTNTLVKIDPTLGVSWTVPTPPGAFAAAQAVGAGNLLGTYTWCTTFYDGARVESSQGAVSPTITVQNQTWNGAFTINGVPANTDTVTFSFNVGGNITRTVTIAISGTPTTAQVAAQLAAAILSQYPANFNTVVATGNVVNFTTALGVNAAAWWFTLGATGGTTATPGVQTYVTGGSSGGQAGLTGIPVSADPQVTTVNIYRIGGSLGQWRLVGSVPNGTTTFIDNLADVNVTGQALVVYRDRPPAFTWITAHQGRIFGFAPDSSVWFSNFNEPWGFNSDTSVLHADYAGYGDSPVVCGSIGTVLVLCKARSTYTVWGSTDADFQVFFNSDTGCASARSASFCIGIGRWLSRRGVQAFDGQTMQNISDGAAQASNIKKVLDGLTALTRLGCASFYSDRAYHLSIPALGKTFRFDERSQAWWRLGWAFGFAITDPENDTDVLASNLDPNHVGEIDQWFGSPLDLGNPVAAYVTSPIFAGEPDATYQADYVRLEGPQLTPGSFATFSITANVGAINGGGADNIPAAVQTDSGPIMLDGSIGAGLNMRQVPISSRIIGYDLQLTISINAVMQTYIGKAIVYGNVRRRLNTAG